MSGGPVWAVLAAAAACWLLITARSARLVSLPDLLLLLLRTRVGRLLVLAAWAEAGFHVFSQRP